MVPNKSGRFLQILSLPISFSLSVYIVLACAGYEPSDNDFHHLSDPEIGIRNVSRSLMFTIGTDFTNAGGGVDEANANEWESYLGGGFTVLEFLSMLEHDSIQKHGMEWYHQGKSCTHYRVNPFFKSLEKNGGKKAGEYWDLLMRTNKRITEGFDYTTWEYVTIDTQEVKKASKEVKQALKKKYPTFLKDRIAYLYLRVLIAEKRFKDAEEFYQSYFANNVRDNSIFHRAHAWKAGILYKQGKLEEAAVEYMRIYHSYFELRTEALLSFRRCIGFHQNYYGRYSWNPEYVNEVPIFNDQLGLRTLNGQTLPGVSVYEFLKTDQEKARFLGMYLTKAYLPGATDLLQKMMERDPANEWAPILISRGIAQLEKQFLPPFQVYHSIDLEEYFPKNENRNEDLEKFYDWVKTWSNKVTGDHKEYFKLTEAYLMFLKGELGDVKGRFEGLISAENKKIGKQAMAFYILCTAAETQNKKVSDIKEIKKNLEWFKNCDLNTAADLENYYLLLLSDHFEKSNKKGEAAWIKFLSKPTPDFDKNQFLLNYTDMLYLCWNQTEFGQWIKVEYPQALKEVKLGHLRNLLMEERWDSAAVMCRELGEDMPVFTTDPFSFELIEKEMTLEKYCLDMSKYSKMFNHESIEKRAHAISSYANGLIHISYFGRGWQIIKSYRSNYEVPIKSSGTDQKEPLPVNHNMYYQSVAKSRAWLIEAARLTSSREKGAAFMFQAAWCEQKMYYTQYQGDYPSPDQEKRKYIRSFRKLYEQYRKTEYYQNALQSCGYLEYWHGEFERGR